MKRTTINKHIYKTGPNSYVILKQINNKRITYKTCETLDEAIKYRDKLIANNWQPLEETPEEKREKEIKEYYKHVQRTSKGYTYRIVNSSDGYMGSTDTIEKALYYRDLYAFSDNKNPPKPNEIDLITNNPYIKNGLKYDLPERLIPRKKHETYGKGSIVKKGKNIISYKTWSKNKRKKGLCLRMRYI